ncbi:respiratory chain complex I subunit 1 family protein [Thermicanus aegyptius]|uniref:respiratory chain complex I subunit 1 family protein n=1 Tax=Thermicanus aegyptius TaxID=94009 RepID=UPI000407A0AC|nr:NADH-quinone oxidoreductase subunit H [Thermicanus aegyptius]
MEIFWTVLFSGVQLFFILLFSPLVQGVIKKTKAVMQNRVGPPLLQPYYDLMKYLKKDSVVSKQASWLTRFTPYLLFALILSAGLFIPTFLPISPLGGWGDFLVVVYLFGLARFFTALTAYDAGGSFGGMGASREMALSAFGEGAFLFTAFAVLFVVGTTQLNFLAPDLLAHHWGWENPAYWLTFVAMLIVLIAETGRIPVDNPDTHLELTMIHEGMLLEYSGRHLGLVHWAAMMKQFLFLSLFLQFFFPWGVPEKMSVGLLLLSILLFLGKIFLIGFFLGLIETLYAKIRLFKVPRLFLSAMFLAFLAMIIHLAL